MLIPFLFLVGCDTKKGGSDSPDSEDPTTHLTHTDVPFTGLSNHTAADADPFMTHDECAMCHEAEHGSEALLDASGRDISPVSLWQATMMANAARDPYYLAAFSHELQAHPEATALIDSTCTRCHAGAAHELTNGGFGYHDLLTSTSDEAHLGRDGVTCTLCHQITDANLGTDASYTGGYVIGDQREIFGPHQDPFANPMQQHVDYTPTASTHLLDSAACATCHTVITKALDEKGEPTGPEFPEQVPYLEWLNSSFANTTSCHDCHMPATDEDGTAITALISTRPIGGNNIEERTPIRRHVFRGSNAAMLTILAENTDILGTVASAEALRQAAEDSALFLSTAATLQLGVTSGKTHDEIVVTIVNQTGHKLPTAYPTRRLVLQLDVLDSTGVAIWQSGTMDAQGNLVDPTGNRLDGVDSEMVHYDRITAQDQVQVYTTRAVDAHGEPTHVLLEAVAYSLDNRILPNGWSDDHELTSWTMPVGTTDDPNHIPGSDTVTYVVPKGGHQVEARLVYQTLPPVNIEMFSDHPTSMVEALQSMHQRNPDVGRVMATARTSL